MNAYRGRDDNGYFWCCGVCHQDFTERGPAEHCCEKLVARSDISSGRQKLTKRPGTRPYKENAGKRFI